MKNKKVLVALVLFPLLWGCSLLAAPQPTPTPCPPCPTAVPPPTATPCPDCPACPACPECPACPAEVQETIKAGRDTEEVISQLKNKLVKLGYKVEYLEAGISSSPSLVVTTKDDEIMIFVGYTYHSQSVQRVVLHIAWNGRITEAKLAQLNAEYNLFKVFAYEGDIVVHETVDFVTGEIDAAELAAYLEWLGEQSERFAEDHHQPPGGSSASSR